METIEADVIDLVLDVEIPRVEDCEMFGRELVHDDDCPALAAGIVCPLSEACFEAYLANCGDDRE